MKSGRPTTFPKALEALGPGEVNRPVPWNTLTDQQREFQAAKMAIHAAMVDRMDREIGRVLDQLRAMGAFENTLIFFLSDNGASAEIMVRDDGHDPTAAAGSAASHLCLGPGWSTVANTPFRRHKTWVHEGGIATPLIVHWPKGIAARGELRHDPGHVIDIVPTILEVAGRALLAADSSDDGPPPAARRKPCAGLRPRRTPWNTTTSGGHTKATAPSAWATGSSSPPRTEPWELYDLATDRTETQQSRAGKPRAGSASCAERWQRHMDEFTALARNDLKTTAQPAGPAKPVKDLILPGESFLVAGRPASS